MSRFFFDGKPVEAQESDTVASALYRAGRRIFSRSFKYHRPRGLLCCSGKCPNCLMQVDGAPNIRTCITPVREGMVVRHQNASPSLERDYLSVAQWADFLMPVGWYYKTFQSKRLWHLAEPHIRKVAGLGEPPTDRMGEYEHLNLKAAVAVIGGGRSGMRAAIRHAEAGADVILVDDQPNLGGHTRYSSAEAAELIRQVSAHPGIRVFSRSSCFGLYEGNLAGVVQPRPHGKVLERLIHLRAGHVVVATGAYETPFVFPNNDIPGVMLSSAALRLIRIYKIKPGDRAVIVGLDSAGVGQALRGIGVELAGSVSAEDVRYAVGGAHLEGIVTRTGNIRCDLVVMCGPKVPDAGLLAQAGGKLAWDPGRAAFLPTGLPPHVSAAGQVSGEGLSDFSGKTCSDRHKRAFVCFCNDVTTADVSDAIDEGFDHIETLKRYTTTTMGPCQGRMCQRAAIEACGRRTERAMADVGVTTSRPPNPSVSLGALAGARHHPVRRTPMHDEHDNLRAAWMDMGDWKRPRYYGSNETVSVREEYAAVRNSAGIIDVSTLGKLDMKGKDAGKLLDKVYTHRFSDLKPGRVRYAVICDDAGIMLDDGTITRLADDHFFLTTTTGNLDFVDQWLRWWLAGTGWDVHITNVTSALAAVNVAGPNARALLQPLTATSLSPFPYMSAKETTVAGVPVCMMRIGFVGETGWEMHYPAEEGANLWRVLVDAGARPFGVEAQRLLRLEKKHVIVGVDSDALTTPFHADMAWVAKFEKPDWVGRRSLLEASQTEPAERLVGFLMADDVLPEDGCPVVIAGRPVGRVTSARYSPHRERAIGLAWVPGAQAHDGAEIEIRSGGKLVKAKVHKAAFYDPEGARLNA
jgi:sarcosine oxidase subunit alpha